MVKCAFVLAGRLSRWLFAISTGGLLCTVLESASACTTRLPRLLLERLWHLTPDAKHYFFICFYDACTQDAHCCW